VSDVGDRWSEWMQAPSSGTARGEIHAAALLGLFRHWRSIECLQRICCGDDLFSEDARVVVRESEAAALAEAWETQYFRGSIGAAVLITALLTATAAQAFDDTKYPNLKGQWHRA